MLRGSYPDGVLQHFYNMVLTCEAVSNYFTPHGTPRAARGGGNTVLHTIGYTAYRLNRQHPGTLDAANRHTPVNFTPQTNFDAQIACQFGPSGGMAGRRGPTISDPQTDEPLIP